MNFAGSVEENSKNELKIQYLQQEAQVKKDLMAYEFELNSKLKIKLMYPYYFNIVIIILFLLFGIFLF